MRGVVFHCLRSFPSRFSSRNTKNHQQQRLRQQQHYKRHEVTRLDYNVHSPFGLRETTSRCIYQPVVCHAQSLAATNRVTEQLNWLTVESFFESCSISLHRSVGEVHRFDGVKSLWSACSTAANRFFEILNGTSCVFIRK
jgi:hypothetical protein